LKCAIPAKCLVLHLWGHPVDRYGMDVSAQCLRILDSTVTRRQLIHLHCFTRDQELVTYLLWIYWDGTDLWSPSSKGLVSFS
jgi:hypothetical protein